MEGSVEMLGRQQCEVEAALRVKIGNGNDVEVVATAVESISLFMRDVHDAGRELEVGVERVVQALLGKLATAVDFDKQGGSGAVPMHQNKILDRSNRALRMDSDISKDNTWIIKQVKENLPKLLGALTMLRDMVKIKVEDASDIEMARQWTEMAAGFFKGLTKVANALGVAGLGEAWFALSSHRVPGDILKGNDMGKPVTEEKLGDLTLLETLKIPFGDRLKVLNSIQPQDRNDLTEENTALLVGGLVVQLKDTRSQVLKASLGAVSRLSGSPGWEGISVEVVKAVVGRLNVSNKTLAAEVGGVVKGCLIKGGGAVEAVATMVATSAVAAVTSKCVEALTAFVDHHQVSPECVVAAAQAGLSSRYQPTRTAAKALQESIRLLQPPPSPLTPEEASPLTLLKLRMKRKNPQQPTRPPTLTDVDVNSIGAFPLAFEV